MAKTRNNRRLFAEALEDRTMFAAGDLDPTFNGTGFNIASQLSPQDELSTTMTTFTDVLGGVHIVLGGYRIDNDPNREVFPGFPDSADTEIVFFTPDGVLDTNLGTLGSIVQRVGLGDSRVAGIAHQVINGVDKIVVAGSTYVSGTDLEFSVTDTDPANPYTVRSAMRDFRAEDVGATLEILQDTANGFITGTYIIRAVNEATGEAFLNQSPANSITPITGGTWTLNSTDVLVSRYTYNALLNTVTLDTAFGNNGHSIIPIARGVNNFDFGYSVVVDNLNRIVVAGYSQNLIGEYDFSLTRLIPNGDLDTTFFFANQPGGPLANRGRVMINAGGDDFADTVNITSNGDIIVAGSSGGSTNANFAFVKLDTFGALVTSFDGSGTPGNGIVTLPKATAGNGFINSIQVYPADAGTLAGFFIATGTNLGTNKDTILVRLNGSTGALDTTFGTGGIVRQDLGGQDSDWGNSLVLQPAGGGLYGIVVGGSIDTPGEGYNMYVARFLSNGNPDNTFFNNTFIHVLSELQVDGAEEHDDFGATVVLDATNRILLSGSSFFGDDPDFDFAVARFLGTPVVAAATVNATSRAIVEEDSSTTSVSIDLLLSTPAIGQVTVNYATQNGTALAGVDYVAKSGSVTFSAGTIKRTVTVQIKNNTQYEANRSFSLAITGATGAKVGSAGTITIRDNDGSWQNVVTPEDADNDGDVEPNDVLKVIDDVNRNGIRSLSQATSTPSLFMDVTGDTMVTPADVLVIIDRVNRNALLRASLTQSSVQSSTQSTSVAPNADAGTFVLAGTFAGTMLVSGGRFAESSSLSVPADFLPTSTALATTASSTQSASLSPTAVDSAVASSGDFSASSDEGAAHVEEEALYELIAAESLN